jgi:hypothetical protein
MSTSFSKKYLVDGSFLSTNDLFKNIVWSRCPSSEVDITVLKRNQGSYYEKF